MRARWRMVIFIFWIYFDKERQKERETAQWNIDATKKCDCELPKHTKWNQHSREWVKENEKQEGKAISHYVLNGGNVKNVRISSSTHLFVWYSSSTDEERRDGNESRFHMSRHIIGTCVWFGVSDWKVWCWFIVWLRRKEGRKEKDDDKNEQKSTTYQEKWNKITHRTSQNLLPSSVWVKNS